MNSLDKTTAAGIRTQLRDAAPELTQRIDKLSARWLTRLTKALDAKADLHVRPKQVNDPIWGTIELYPWEVALIDTALLQRLRGVRQLGLAQLVFPSVTHDRFEHILGVIGAVEMTLRALSRQIERWNSEYPDTPVPTIKDEDRHALRLAALFHDLGHGPFSHALEPVLEPTALLRTPQHDADPAAPDWRYDLETLRAKLLELYSFNEPPQTSELIAAMIVLSDAVFTVFADRHFPLPGSVDPAALQVRIAAAIVGAIEGVGADHLGAIISGQIDADKLDYLQRDAHHAGLEIGFDTSRLMSKIELLRVRNDNIDASMKDVRNRVAKSPDQTLLQIGIAASGFGSFEQMLIGRTFLYDRLYHHHKVRAAEAMAQRLILVAERDRETRFDLEDIFLDVGDEVVLRIFAGDVGHPQIGELPDSVKDLARGLLDRDLLHRAYALRGRFIGVAPELDDERTELKQQELWKRVVRDLGTLKQRYELGEEIHELALKCANALAAHGVPDMEKRRERLVQVGPEQILVDLPSLKANAIRIFARYPNGRLRVPEFSFNPIKWSNAYELQKRTAYVFCPRDVVPVVSLAAKIVFFGRYGVVMAKEADGYIKASQTVETDWIEALVKAGIIDDEAKAHLTERRLSLLSIAGDDMQVPQAWIEINEDFAVNLARQLNKYLSGGLSARHLKALGEVLTAMWALVDSWHDSDQPTEPLKDEAALQKEVRRLLKMRGLRVEEGLAVGGGKLDLYLNDAILLENKIEGESAEPADAKPAAGMQGRRYAIALDSQVVLVVIGYQPKPGQMLGKTDSITVHPIIKDGDDRVELRFVLPYGAVAPSREKIDPIRKASGRRKNV